MFGEGDVQRLIEAVSGDQLAEVQSIVHKCGNEIITAILDGDGWAAVHYAVFRGNSAILAWFLAQHISCCNALTSVSCLMSKRLSWVIVSLSPSGSLCSGDALF
eukprot:m.43528 g.43528  ORF g.43528 m.43528 type:complete len:104 (+) comp46731_c0_seq1:25-336(+)